MMQKYISNLVENIPDNIKNVTHPQKLDLVLDSGLFNGSYMTGALLIVKEMERRNYVCVEQISGASIGSFCALLYHIDALDLMSELYEIMIVHMKQYFNLNTFEIAFEKIKKRMPPNVCETMNNRVFISYYNIKKGKKVIKSNYRNMNEIFDAIKRSCFIPFVINGNMLHKKKYMDGINPYIFPSIKNKKCLYLDLYGTDKIKYLCSIKNEKTNFHRILTGMLDIQLFLIKQSSTSMCSYVEDWSILHTCRNKLKMQVLETILFSIARYSYIVKKYISEYMQNNEYILDYLYNSVIFKLIIIIN